MAGITHTLYCLYIFQDDSGCLRHGSYSGDWIMDENSPTEFLSNLYDAIRERTKLNKNNFVGIMNLIDLSAFGEFPYNSVNKNDRESIINKIKDTIGNK